MSRIKSPDRGSPPRLEFPKTQRSPSPKKEAGPTAVSTATDMGHARMPPSSRRQRGQAVGSDAANSPARRASLPGRDESSTLSPPQAARMDAAVKASVAEFARDRHPATARQGVERAEAFQKTQLELSRTISSIVHTDRLPPEQANQTSARLAVAREVLLQEWKMEHDDKLSRTELYGLLACGEVHHRYRTHHGMSPEHMPPLRVRINGGMDHVRPAHTDPTPRGDTGASVDHTPESMQLGAATVNDTAVVSDVHEAEHVAQLNTRDFSNVDEFRPLEARDGGQPYRARRLEVARGLPSVGRKDDTDAYHADLLETQANVEESAVRTQVMDEMGAILHGLRQGKPDPLTEDCEINKLSRALLHASRKANNATGWTASAYRAALDLALKINPRRPETLADYDFSRSEIPQRMENILRLFADLRDTAQSAKWDDGDSAVVRWQLNDMQDFLEGPIARDGSAEMHLQEIERRLVDINAELASRHADRRIPEPSLYDFHRDKHHPWMPLQRMLTTLPQGWTDGNAPSALDAFLTARAESGFEDAVTKLHQRLDDDEEVSGKDLSDAVVLLAAKLTGTDPADWTDRMRPEVDINEVDTVDLDHVDGFNVAPDQRRKAVFEGSTLQAHIPRPLVNDHDLRDRLAGLAEELAYTVSGVMAHDNPSASTQDYANYVRISDAVQIQDKALFSSLQPFWQDVRRLKAGSDARIAGEPSGAAAIFRRVVATMPEKTEGRAWHEGKRRETKLSGDRGDAASVDLYMTENMERWQLPPVALRRAVKGASPAAIQESVERLPSRLRHRVKEAASQPGIPVELSPEEARLLEGLGLLKDRCIASPAIARIILEAR